MAALSLGRRAEAAGSARWYASVSEAAVEAQRLNKPMMLDFWAEWCAPCKAMEKEVYATEAFAVASQPFVLVRIDFDREPAVSRKYSTEALPTIVFADSYGGELFRYSGFLNGNGFVELMRSLPHDATEFNRLNRVLARDKNNFAALEAMGQKLRSAGLFRRSNDYYARALREDGAKRSAAAREAILAGMGANYLEVQAGKQAAEVFARCLREFPASPLNGEWRRNLALAEGMQQPTRPAAR